MQDAIRNSEAGVASPQLLADDERGFRESVQHASRHYGLDAALIVRDYWLVTTLHAWRHAVGEGYVRRSYPNPDLSEAENLVGQFVFGGGTSLSAAWGITQRWSQDIDLTYAPLDAAPVWVERRPVMSMIGRICDDGRLSAHPELGGFEVATLGPGTTAMNKLLAQTQTSGSGDFDGIAERARDIYDLACIARDRAMFEGHIGRDSKALLHLSESWLPEGSPKRPPDGFGSLRSFDPTTREHEALARGYEDVMNGMVWGEKIALNEAIRLAVSLDPGPSEPYRPPEPNPLVAYPRH